MKDVLEQSGLYTESIKDQIARAQDLSEEYDILKKKVSDVKEASNLDRGEAQLYANAKKASGAGFAGGSGWFGQWTGIGQDDIDENIEDVGQSLAALQLKLEKFGDATKAKMNEVANSILGARAAGMSFEEKMAVICSSRGTNGYWDTFVKKVSGGKIDIENDLKNLSGDLDDFGHNFGEITTDDIPKYLEYMAKERGMSLDEFSKWCKAHPQSLRLCLIRCFLQQTKKFQVLLKGLEA